MPKYRRDSAAGADARPAFNRPPGVRPSPAPDDELWAPKRRPQEKAKQSPATSPEKKNAAGKRKSSAPVRPTRDRDRAKYSSGTSTGSSSQLLSADSLLKLNAHNEKITIEEKAQAKKRKEKQYKNIKGTAPAQHRRKKKNRNVSGAILEEGRANEKHTYGRQRGDRREYTRNRNASKGESNRKCWIFLGIVALLLIIFIPVGVVVSRKSKSGTSSTVSDTNSDPTNTCDGNDIPAAARGTYLDVSTWMDTTDFNCTYTNETVGGLPVIGLFSTWDDSAQVNSNVPALNQNWTYGTMPIRGVNLGGWLDIEPFITPSLFDAYAAVDGVVDEWTLTEKLGSAAAGVLEKHYATFVTQQTFADIASAGLDHVRIPYPYWAVTTYQGDPYVPKIAWRYLLRAIEWAREAGIRVNLDLHSLPGSQNGWAHSGHQGAIGWLNGTDGTLNGQRSLDLHNQLSQFFAQERYDNVVTIYGLVNEPKMLVLPTQSVLDWNEQAIQIVRGNGLKQHIAFGDGFLALTAWDDIFKGVDSGLVMDTHQYQIFNVDQLALKHQDKINLACSGWTGLMVAANNPSTGWGPTLDGEWSQADTDCAPYLNNVGVGSRWAGTLDTGDASTSVLTQVCASPPCSCDDANADPSQYSSDYKQFLQMYAEAQMHSFEQAWGWFYWTWETESAVQWSWKLGLAAGILPEKAYDPSFKCDTAVPDFSDLGDSY